MALPRPQPPTGLREHAVNSIGGAQTIWVRMG